MPRSDRFAAESARRGPYELAYTVIRGYDAPAPALVRAAGPAPVMVAARRDDDDPPPRLRLLR